MMCVKATCRACEGTGYNMDFGNPTSIFCPTCKGVGVLILTPDNWDIEIENK
jgi:DnaJ-class molecular chaperone